MKSFGFSDDFRTHSCELISFHNTNFINLSQRWQIITRYLKPLRRVRSNKTNFFAHTYVNYRGFVHSYTGGKGNDRSIENVCSNKSNYFDEFCGVSLWLLRHLDQNRTWNVDTMILLNIPNSPLQVSPNKTAAFDESTNKCILRRTCLFNFYDYYHSYFIRFFFLLLFKFRVGKII